MMPGFLLLGSFLALAHEQLCMWVKVKAWLCQGSSGGFQSQVGTRALLSSSPLSPGSVRCTALPYTVPAPRTAQLSLQSQPTSEAVERELGEDISTIHTSRVSSVHRQGKCASGWPLQILTHGIQTPHSALPTSEPAALSLILAHICLWNRLSLIPLAWVLLPGHSLKSPPLVAGWFLMVLNGMHTCGCCDANRGCYGADPLNYFCTLGRPHHLPGTGTATSKSNGVKIKPLEEKYKLLTSFLQCQPDILKKKLRFLLLLPLLCHSGISSTTGNRGYDFTSLNLTVPKGSCFFPICFWKPIRLRAAWGIANLLIQCTQTCGTAEWKLESRMLVRIHLAKYLHARGPHVQAQVHQALQLFWHPDLLNRIGDLNIKECSKCFLVHAETAGYCKLEFSIPVTAQINTPMWSPLHQYLHIHSLHGKSSCRKEPQAGTEAGIAAVTVLVLQGTWSWLAQTTPDVHPSTSSAQPALTPWQRRCLRGLSEMQM